MISSLAQTNDRAIQTPTMVKRKAMKIKANLEDSQTPLDHIMAMLTNSIEVGNRHPYLTDNEVANYDLSQDKDGNLIGVAVNLRSSFSGDSYKPRPHTLLIISPEGKTRLEPGTRLFGAALMIGHQAFRGLARNRLDPGQAADIYVAVDYPTGAFLHTQTGRPVAVAIKNANVKNVVSFFTRNFPLSRVIVCLNGDDETCASRIKAVRAVKKMGGLVTYPVFNKYEKFQDFRSFNDLSLAHGPDLAMKRLQDGIRGGH